MVMFSCESLRELVVRFAGEPFINRLLCIWPKLIFHKLVRCIAFYFWK